MHKILIVIPGLDSTGPISGAIALANLLSTEYQVTLLSLRPPKSAYAAICSDVKLQYLSNQMSFLDKLCHFKQNGYNSDLIFTFCFMPELYAYIGDFKSKAIASVREVRVDNYVDTYGILKGTVLARIHNFISERLAWRVVMNRHMQKQFSVSRVCHLTPNFIDVPLKMPSFSERELPSIGIVGALEKRKSPQVVLEMLNLNKDKISSGFFYGDGSLKLELQKYVESHNIKNIHFVSDENDKPTIFSSFDIFVHASYSEGMSRALLEALYYQKICVIRDIPQHHEFKSFKNVIFFKQDNELDQAIKAAVHQYRAAEDSFVTVLPKQYLASGARDFYLKFIESLILS